ncbi:MAG: NTP/NDP exchange transporter [Puniceicoccales bacterium]|jgi:AAA family ATP:ADP antiporter|nr:NTP/NDP exchange transporter [Puniceicoccales bacterium]
MVQEQTKEFSKLRRIFFPLHTYELKKALPMSLIFFCILFNYTCLRNIKDSLIVTGPGSDAEVIPFIKGFCVVPSAIIFMLLYAKASNILSNEKLFYFSLTPFIVFFGAFAYLIYPNLGTLHPSLDTITTWRAAAPKFLYWPIAIVGNWSYVLFFILAELWGGVLLSLSFWQFANQITKTSEAKRMYSFFGLMAQMAVLASGIVGEHFSNIKNKVGVGVDPWQISLNWLMGIVVVLGIVAMVTFRWIYTNVLTDKRFYDKPELPGNSGGKKKKSVPLSQSFKIIFTSPYIGLIAALVMCYGISINLVEALWKKQVGMKYTNPNDYNSFMSQYIFWTGIASMIIIVFAGNILRVCKWFTAAIITPLLFVIVGSLFFIFVLFKENLTTSLDSIGLTPLSASVFLGAAVVLIAKSTKYALFDPTKEMSYIPLDEEMKVKGKAVVEVVGGRMGKGGGAWINSGLLSVIPGATFFTIVPYTFSIFVVICISWLVVVKLLSNRIEAVSEDASQKNSPASAS